MSLIRFPVERRQPTRLLTLVELQNEIGMSERWLRYRVAEGMPCRRYGKRLRFSLDDVQTWLGERYGA